MWRACDGHLVCFRYKCFGVWSAEFGSGLEQSGHRSQPDLCVRTPLACECMCYSVFYLLIQSDFSQLSRPSHYSDCFLQPVSALTSDRPKSPAAQRAAAGGGGGGGGKGKARGKKGKGGKTKPEPPEETDPRKLELLSWVSDVMRTHCHPEHQTFISSAQFILSLDHKHKPAADTETLKLTHWFQMNQLLN